MTEDLISKKELLELTGISYGALYRWKRKELIPDSWFIKKATFTGQETFFPREDMLERVRLILEGKEELSLDDIAEVLKPMPDYIELSPADLLPLVSQATQALLSEYGWGGTPVKITAAVQAVCVERLLAGGQLAVAEIEDVLQAMWKSPMGDGGWLLRFFRKQGVALPCVCRHDTAVFTDGRAVLIAEINFDAVAADIVRDLRQKEGNHA